LLKTAPVTCFGWIWLLVPLLPFDISTVTICCYPRGSKSFDSKLLSVVLLPLDPRWLTVCVEMYEWIQKNSVVIRGFGLKMGWKKVHVLHFCVF